MTLLCDVIFELLMIKSFAMFCVGIGTELRKYGIEVLVLVISAQSEVLRRVIVTQSRPSFWFFLATYNVTDEKKTT